LKSFLVSVKQSRRPRHRPLFWTRAAGGVTAERREASVGLPSSGVETRARRFGRGVAHRRRGARAGAMASVEQYLTVLAGAQSAQNAEAQRLAAQMQIEVRLPRDRSASGHIVTRSIRVAATAPFRPPPRRVDRSIPSFSHLFRCARERKLALLVPRQSAFRFSGTRPSSFARRATTEPKKKKLTVANRLLFIPHTRHTL
jgi:hypothetical protein